MDNSYHMTIKRHRLNNWHYDCPAVFIEEIEVGLVLDRNSYIICICPYNDLKKELEAFMAEYPVWETVSEAQFEFEKVTLLADWLSVFAENTYGWTKYEKKTILPVHSCPYDFN